MRRHVCGTCSQVFVHSTAPHVVDRSVHQRPQRHQAAFEHCARRAGDGHGAQFQRADGQRRGAKRVAEFVNQDFPAHQPTVAIFASTGGMSPEPSRGSTISGEPWTAK
jgi:hypothetical protein